jgi:hypothetical protein
LSLPYFVSRVLRPAALLLLCVSQAFAQYGFQHWTVDDGLPQSIVRGVTQTADGYLWIATLDGLVRFDGMRFTVFNRSNTPGIVTNRFGGMNQGRDGDLWLDDEIGGITRYHQGQFRNYGLREGIARNVVNGTTVDDAGNLWILSGNQIQRWDEAIGRFVSVDPPGLASNDRTPSDKVPKETPVPYRSLRWDNAGFWGPDGEIIRCFVRGRLLSFPRPSSVPATSIWDAAIDQEGSLWLETLAGRQVRITPDKVIHGVPARATMLYRVGHGQPVTMTVGHRLSRTLDFLSSGKDVSVPITRLVQDREGSLWAGTEGDGLYRLQRQAVHVISKEQGLADRDDYAVYQDRSGAV